jgi:signal transduction histidine kinase
MPASVRSWIRRGALAGLRGLALTVVTLPVNIVLFVLSVVALVFTVLGIGLVAFPAVTELVRRFAGYHRRLVGQWTGVDVPVPYGPLPEPDRRRVWRRYRWVVTDPATWRDLLWLLAAIPASMVLALAPAALIGNGVEGLIGVPVLLYSLSVTYGYGVTWPIDNLPQALLTWPQAVVLIAVGLTVSPYAIRFFGFFNRSLLAPTRAAALARRVERLTETRSSAVDAQATELRRIERDLHDGAQARLVALSMNLGLAEELMARDPATALRLMAEAREHSGQALAELRDLVRGIHPPVLVERGLDGAVRALALNSPVRVDVDIDLAGRPPAPVESAAYFAVAESLTNVTKHSGAKTARIRLTHNGSRLIIVVHDDGAGGADPSGGTGLRGIERRLSAFDGTMSVASPPGGPTTVTMELPCGLSSPKTSPSSGTG